MRIRSAAIPVGHSIRSGLTVGGTFIVGSLTGHTLTGMWIGLATLLLAAGEREGTYRLNFRIIAISTPIAACGYLLGFVQHIPLVALIPLMGAIALLAGLIAGFGPEFSVAGMQFLLVGSIAIGVDDIDWWTPIWLYLVGGALYASLLAIEMIVNPHRPQRTVLVALLQSLADLATARVADLDDCVNTTVDQKVGSRTASARIAATTAYRNATARIAEVPVHRMGSAADWSLDAEVVSAADRVQALLLASTDTVELTAVGEHLASLAESLGRRDAAPTSPSTLVRTQESPLCRRVRALDEALAGSGRSIPELRRGFTFPVIGSQVVFAAVRLSLCFAIAVGARAYFPFSHWFWVPLTVCLVMKPDFGSVFSRAILRVIGTVIGAAIATVVILLVPKGWEIGVALGLLSACVPWFMMRSYALQAVAITPVVILLVDLISPGDGSANYSWQRIGATVIGGAVVIVFGYLIWPHSRRAWVADHFATAMEGIATHLRIAATPIPEDENAATSRHDELVAARRRSYRSLSDLQTRMQQALAEPAPAGTTAMAWIPVSTAAGRLADAVTIYAGQRLSGTLPSDTADGEALACRIVGLGTGEEFSGTGGPMLVQRGSGLDEIDDELFRLRGLLER